MTIGIGAYGPRAGLAVYRALQSAERVGRGAICGFATYAAIASDGRVFRHQTQRGGSATLFIEGEATGVPPPEDVADAIAAAVISSGPERPEPLSQFLAADAAGGLVTGHRLPNGVSVDGTALNLDTLNHLIAGKSAKEAVDLVIDRNREADVGLLAVDLRGGAYSRNSDRVRRRPDLGHARVEDATAGAVVEVLHNAIRPFPATAIIAAGVALDTMRGDPKAAGWITIEAGVPLVLGEENAVHCGKELRAQRVVTTDPTIVKGRHACAGIYLHSKVYSDDKLIGLTMFEPITAVEDGTITEMSGQSVMRMNYCAPH
jgi:hypothetical protein